MWSGVYRRLRKNMSFYNTPEASGLKEVGHIDLGGGYEFDLLVLWVRESDGALLYGTDSGCSCPSPFEDQTVEGLTVLPPGECGLDELDSAIKVWFAENSYRDITYSDKDRLVTAAREVQRGIRRLPIKDNKEYDSRKILVASWLKLTDYLNVRPGGKVYGKELLYGSFDENATWVAVLDQGEDGIGLIGFSTETRLKEFLTEETSEDVTVMSCWNNDTRKKVTITREF
jgi:hypothetical protein